MAASDERELVYEWAEHGPRTVRWPAHIMIDDETLRDGLQSPSVIDPPLDAKVRILYLMESFGIETADVGLPGAGARQREAVLRLCREISEHHLRIRPNCAARTMIVDIQPIAEISQLVGIPIEACLFIGSSPIRQYAEGWDIGHIRRQSVEAISFAVREGLPVMFVTEDTVRSSPDDLRVLITAAIEAGASRVCLCDTCGAATPEAAFNLVSFVRQLISEIGRDVGIDWHGHRDRGLDLANTLAAIQAGATRVHGTALGIGERVGNTPIEVLLVNLRLLGLRRNDLSRLSAYVELVSRSTGVPIPVNTPVVGTDAFRTATGVHAAAVVKANKKGHHWLADRVYSGVPAKWIGREQEIEVGPMSGNSNVVYYLSSRGIEFDEGTVRAILDVAKQSPRVLTREEILAVVHRWAVASKS